VKRLNWNIWLKPFTTEAWTGNAGQVRVLGRS
jgi:hypothetical protein